MKRGGLISSSLGSLCRVGSLGSLGCRVDHYVIDHSITTHRNKYCIIPTIHSLGLSSAFEIDVEDDPVVDVCRRNDLRDRSLVLT